jgi:hypothetical protein
MMEVIMPDSRREANEVNMASEPQSIDPNPHVKLFIRFIEQLSYYEDVFITDLHLDLGGGRIYFRYYGHLCSVKLSIE